MPSLKDIRTRINATKNTRKITSAMKLVAAAKLKRATDAVQASRPYANKMVHLIDQLASFLEEDAHPLLEQPEREDHLLVIICSSDRGLAGGFNANLFRAVDRFLKSKQDLSESIRLVTIGRKAYQYYRNSGFEIVKNVEGVVGSVSFASAKSVAQIGMDMFTRGDVDKVYLVYNEFQSAIAINQIIKPLIPLQPQGDEESTELVEAGDAGAPNEYIYEPDEVSLLGSLLPNSVEVTVFQALLESEASEQGSRMTAMDNATNNATDLIDNLTLQYNRARQAYITKELVEIVSGAEALKG